MNSATLGAVCCIVTCLACADTRRGDDARESKDERTARIFVNDSVAASMAPGVAVSGAVIVEVEAPDSSSARLASIAARQFARLEQDARIQRANQVILSIRRRRSGIMADTWEREVYALRRAADGSWEPAAR